MTYFLIEFRLQGYAKQYAKWVRERVYQKAMELGIKEVGKQKLVSHITLFGQAETNNLQNIIREVEKIGRKYTLVPFKLGVKRGKFQKTDANWLYLDVHPSPDLEQLRYELAQSLLSLERIIFNTCRFHDHKSKYTFHSSIGKYDPRDKDKFEKLFDYAETKCSLVTFKQHKASVFGRLLNIIKKYIFRVEEDNLGINQHLLRITILGRKSHIEREYDLVLKRLLSRREALSRYWRSQTIERLKELRSPPQEEHLSISNRSVYFIGDTHFDHKNIIKYCHRPFSNIVEMNEAIRNNWNKTVSANDIVYFLGDWTFGWGHKPVKYWVRQLKGHVISIRGSHDHEARDVKFENTRVLHTDGHSFLLIHNPAERKTEWHGWIIHGHVHNNNMGRYPFINGEQKTINVSAEVTNYQPVSLSYLISLNLDSIKRMQKIDSQPERW